jgi:hypothetical protein
MSRRRKHGFLKRSLPRFGGEARQCEATSKRTGQRCGAFALKGSGLCPKHLGTNPDGSSHLGPANTNWHGGVSKPCYSGPPIFKPRYCGPETLNDLMRAAESDPEISSLNPEISVVTAAIQADVRRLGEIDPYAYAEPIDQLIAGMKASDSGEIRAALNRLAELRSGTRDDEATWNRILKLIERRRRLVDTQRRLAVESSLALPREQALRIAIGLLEAVTRNVRDAETVNNIREEFRRIIGAVDPTVRTSDAVH